MSSIKLKSRISKRAWNIIFASILAVIIVVSLLFYTNYNVKMIKQDYKFRISELQQQTSVKVNSLKSEIQSLGGNLTLQIGHVENNLQNFKKQNQREIKTLSDLIDQIEQQSSIKLSELKGELENIRIQSADFSAIVDRVLQSVVSVKTDLGQGSGAIISKSGYIVTNVHVINGASSITVQTYSGKSYTVDSIAGYDSKADIAVLKVSIPDLETLSLGNSDDVKVGEKVIAAGNPAGLAFTVTEGIVSAARKDQSGINYIQTDVPINPGNSGGPLINVKGEIIGINNFKIGGFEGLGFAISSNNVKAVVDKIINDYEAGQNQ